MASSARRGVMSVLACIVQNRRRSDPPRRWSLLLFRFEDFQLLVEFSNHSLQFIDCGVVLLHKSLLFLVCLFLLIRGHLRNIFGRGIQFQIEAVQINIHLAVVAVEIVLGSDHLVTTGRCAFGGWGGRLRVSTGRLCVGSQTERENKRKRYPSLHRESSSYRDK